MPSGHLLLEVYWAAKNSPEGGISVTTTPISGRQWMDRWILIYIYINVSKLQNLSPIFQAQSLVLDEPLDSRTGSDPEYRINTEDIVMTAGPGACLILTPETQSLCLNLPYLYFYVTMRGTKQQN